MPQGKKQDQQGQQDQRNHAEEFTVPEGWASVMFDKAYDLQERYRKLVEARRANREALRALAAQDLLSEEEIAELAELYPDRSKGDTDTAEIAADAPAAA